MIKVDGVSRITKIEQKGTYYVGVLYNSYKKFGTQTEYETEFVNCRIVGKAAEQIKQFKNKDKILIIEGQLRMEKNKYPVITIFECSTFQEDMGY